MNYHDNPWFRDSEMPKELANDKQRLADEEFRHIWLGDCMPAVAGAIYFRAMAQLEADGRVKDVPHDPMLKTHVIWDLGYNDATSIILAQQAAGEVRIIHYIEDRQRTLPDYSQQLQALVFHGMRPQWGDLYLPHDGFARRHQTGITDAELMLRLGWNPRPVPNIAVQRGIDRAQELFPKLYIDRSCGRLVECLKRYRWTPRNNGTESSVPLHDEFSHGADAFRYLALIQPDLRNEEHWAAPINYGTSCYA
jgi:phage terminase large subunit